MDTRPKRVTMEDFERRIMEVNADDWYIPECSLEWIAEMEYSIYEQECNDELE